MITNNRKILKMLKKIFFYLYYKWHDQRLFKIIKRLESGDLESIKNKYKNLNAKYCKYFDHYKTSLFALKRCIMLGLPFSSRKKILDLGCGFGVFGLHAKSFGHEYTGLDMWDEADVNSHLFRDVFEALHPGKKRIDERIEKFQKLNKIDQKYDIITAFQICFTLFNSEQAWDVSEWRFFLLDLDAHLLENGVILLAFSKPEKSQLFRSQGVESFFYTIGAEINGPYVKLHKNTLQNAKNYFE
jgi:2-polyprenyl-3-methyl-5-hydroxy-6-metoxy-1,4-benzoquinol methylase